MKNKFNPDLWTPVITEHPKPEKKYRRSKPHIFNYYQPLSERYEVPGLLPRIPKSPTNTNPCDTNPDST